jgi:RNA polymerase sigma factor (TIGR02999 family)
VCMEEMLHQAKGIDSSDRPSATELLRLVYDELRRLAASRLAHEKPGQTLDSTALAHEAWLRIIRQGDRKWADSRHFYFAAATAMRRILIETARRKSRLKHGGQFQRVELTDTALASPMKSEQILTIAPATHPTGND